MLAEVLDVAYDKPGINWIAKGSGLTSTFLN